MPKFLTNEKIFSIGDKFKIKDEKENDVDQVIGKVASFGDQLSFQDMDGNQLFFVKEKPVNLLKVHEVYNKGDEKSGDLCLGLKKKLTFSKPKFEIEAPGGAKCIVDGGIVQHDFTIGRDGVVVATISKKFFAMSDRCGADVLDEEDPASILVICIALDQALHDK